MSLPLHTQGTLRALASRRRALPQGLLRFPDDKWSGTRYSQCPVPDHYDWSRFEPAWPLRQMLKYVQQAQQAAVRAAARRKRWGLAMRSSDP
jgi:hypothetical protein